MESAIVENSQMWEFLNPSTLQTAVSNVLILFNLVATVLVTSLVLDKASPSWVGPRNLSFQLGRMGPPTPRRLAGTVKIQVTT